MPLQCKAIDREHLFALSTFHTNSRAATGMFAVDNITIGMISSKLIGSHNYLGLYVHLLLEVCHGDWCRMTLLISTIWQRLYDYGLLYLS